MLRRLSSKKIYQGYHFCLVKDRFALHTDPRKIMTREVIDHPGAVAILPFVDKKNILLLRQFRYTVKGNLWEIPAGTLEKNEKPLSCAKREIEEETGFRARRWRHLTTFFTAPGITNEKMFLYKAWDLALGVKNLDADEYIEHKTVPLSKALQMIEKGLIRDAKTIVGILWASSALKKGIFP
jgi:ADP-ribose pyrophosphatase